MKLSSDKPVSRSVMANENIRMLCGLLSIFGFLVIIAQNRKFSKNDEAAITANIASLAFTSEFSSPLSGFGVEMFRISESVAVLFVSRVPTILRGLGKISTSYLKEYNFMN